MAFFLDNRVSRAEVTSSPVLGFIVLQLGALCRKVMGLLTMAEVFAWRLPVPLELVQGRPS